MFTLRKREVIPSYPHRLPIFRRVSTSAALFCLMSSTLALADSADHQRQTVSQTGSGAELTTPSIAQEVFIDGLDFAPPVPDGSKCPQWYDLAMQFFPPHEWDTIDFLLHRESRCDLHALNPKDTNGKPSYSLFQINGFWCRPSKHYDQGFLQQQGILTTCNDLFQPKTQFRAARAIYVEGLVRHSMGWRSWGSYPETR